jgi:hypothetical protein
VSNDRFVVTTELDTSSFQSRREVRALLRDVTIELRRLEQVDGRLSQPRLRRSRRERCVVSVSLTVESHSHHDAADRGIVALRTCIHAAGGSTAGWNGLDAQSSLVTTPGVETWTDLALRGIPSTTSSAE